jgi:hypothetical protein
MIRNGRPALTHFAPDELLFLRYGVDDFVNGQLAAAAIHFPKQSVNRGRFSEPGDVLFHNDGKYDGLGAVEFDVADIPATITGDQGSTYRFFMHHEPLDDNYGHSEIWSARPRAEEEYREPSKSTKLQFRMQLCKRILASRIRIAAVRSRA